MISLSPSEMKIIINIIQKNYKKCKVLVFGSRYKNTNKSYSDLDIALVGERKLTLEELGKLKDAFEESELNFSVDVLDWNRLDDNFRKIIQNGYEEIYNGV